MEFNLITHLHRQAEFSEKTFGPGARVDGVCDHITKELHEVKACGGALAEWIDVIILAFDGAWRSGATPEQIVDALVAKQGKNEGRAWPDWRTQPLGKAIEHDRSTEGPKAPRVYISGPMSGLPEHNFPAFNAEAAQLRSLGYEVINPVDINGDSSTPWEECLRRDLIELLGCDILALLPGWQISKGAQLELHVAHRVGMPIVIASDLKAQPMPMAA